MSYFCPDCPKASVLWYNLPTYHTTLENQQRNSLDVQRKGKLREIPVWITIEDPWEGKGNRREKRNRNSSSYNECFSLRVGKSSRGFLRQMVSIELSISHSGSSSMVMGLTESHLKTPYKQKRSTLRSWFNLPVQLSHISHKTHYHSFQFAVSAAVLQTVADVHSKQIPVWDSSASQVKSPDLRAFLSPAPLFFCRNWQHTGFFPQRCDT